ncbi:hypothetical protein M501DRAFT_1000098 [Patellaria atrata CBS 101060]|uniref:Uncharacterized protein n=1 Tax=Patellaria atrata CBS 101060 TaxID=1346257 RepID=A0A9P4S403_9PEZI|nr:hypothetical protein M501DRAFT_1000098 [Patellaria atrata CBS 101060]
MDRHRHITKSTMPQSSQHIKTRNRPSLDVKFSLSLIACYNQEWFERSEVDLKHLSVNLESFERN